jgi:Domain of unknown function (DUF4136)
VGRAIMDLGNAVQTAAGAFARAETVPTRGRCVESGTTAGPRPDLAEIRQVGQRATLSDPPDDLRNNGPVEGLSGALRPECPGPSAFKVGLTVAAAVQTQPVDRKDQSNMKKQLVISIVTLVCLLPALVIAQKVSYDFEKSANFAAYKTYAHKDGTKVGQPLIDDRIDAAIDSALTAKGFTKSDKPDVFVVYHVAFDKQKDISTYSSGYAGGYGPYGWGYGGGMGSTTTQVRDILVGTLVIDMADAAKGQLVWRGMGVKEVDTQAKPEKRDKSITNAVNKIFKNYPPKQKG